MEEEPTSLKLKKSWQSSKEFVAKRYHNLTDFIDKTYTSNKEKGRYKALKMHFAKYVLVFLDIFYMVNYFRTKINAYVSAYDQYWHDWENSKHKFMFWLELDLLSIYWIVTGGILLFASVFGMISAFKENIIWTNVFGVLMTIVFLIQISSAIIAFQFIGKSQSIASQSINNLMNSYSKSHIQKERMDWIQRNFKCCGNDGPSDWNQISKFAKTSESYGYSYYRSMTTTTLSTPLPDRTPSSCCFDGSNYNNLSCDKYYQSGCGIHLREVISETVMIVGSLALAIAVFEILGIVFAFVVAKIIRKTKSFIAIQQYEALPMSSEIPPAKAEENVPKDVETI